MKKRLFTIAVILLIILPQILSFAGCTKDETYSVRFFDSDGVTQIGETQNLTKGAEFNVEKAPEKDGLQFDGWVLNGGIYDFNTDGAKCVTGDKTFIAQYSAKKYTISYYDGETLLKEEKLSKGAKLTPPKISEKPGFVFKGWVKEGETEFYNMNSSVRADLKLVAKYERTAFTVTFFDSDGKTVLYQTTVNKGEIAVYQGHALEKTIDGEKWIFDSWGDMEPVYDDVSYTAVYRLQTLVCESGGDSYDRDLENW